MSTILIVDDESSLRFLLRIAFEGAGHDVVEAPNGAVALDWIAETRPDLVVTDFMMPVMNGGELIARLRSEPRTAGIPIMLVTATRTHGDVAADATLRKPFEPDVVVATARALIEADA